MSEIVKIVSDSPRPTKGTAGLKCHVLSSATTVSALAEATGGIGPGHFVDSYINNLNFD